MIDPEVRDKIQSLLQPDEKLLWADRPRKFPIGYTTTIIGFLSIFIIAFPLQLGWALIQNDPSSVHMTINDVAIDENTSMGTIWYAFIGSVSLIAVLAGLGYFYLRRLTRELYAITTKSALVVRPFFPFQFIRIRQEAFNHIIWTGNDAIGTLSFQQHDNPPLGKIIKNFDAERMKFHNVTNPQKVMALIYKQFPSTIKEHSHE